MYMMFCPPWTQVRPRGIDGLGPKLLRSCALALYKPLHHLFQLSLSRHAFPSEWRLHKITPLFKSGDRTVVSNYRPISLLCSVSKVLERLVYMKCSNTILSSISTSQFGFLKQRSCLQQLLVFLNYLHESISAKTQVDTIYMVFRKAFDSVGHRDLLIKLHKIGISGSLWLWFKAYLSSRYHCVSLNYHLSSLLPVLSGVPQGSILGPLLFLVFLNDLPPCVSHSVPLMFADDTKCFRSIASSSDCHFLQHDLLSLEEWSQTWELFFNVDKFAHLSFHPSSSISSNYVIDNKVIGQHSSHRDLGIIMTSDLSWSEQYEMMASKAYRSLGLLRRHFSRHISSAAKKSLYVSLVRSRLTYCSVIWRPHLIKDILKLEGIQRRSTRFILNDNVSGYKDRLISLHLLPLMMEYELSDILFFLKSLKTRTAHFDITEYVSFTSNCTRSMDSSKLQHRYARSHHLSHFYFVRLPRLWNSLPPINLDLPIYLILRSLRESFWSHFLLHFNPDLPCTFHYLCPCAKCSHSPSVPHFS